VVFDITLVSTDGEVLVEIDEFVMKRLPGDQLFAKQTRPPAGMPIMSAAEMTIDRIVADGIASDDGMRALERLLRAGSPSQVLVSPYDPVAWESLLEAASGAEAVPAVTPGSAVVSQPRPSLSTPFVPPANEVEKRLASIWKDALGLAELGVEDNFFELGGHSLGLVQVIMKCRKALQADIPVGDPELLSNPTIKAMARFASFKRDLGPAVGLSTIRKVSREQYRAN
jgi:acyl carrier protein